MSSNQKTKRILYAVLCDARSLSHRIISRKNDYISIFALKRTRDQFIHIFRSKFDQITIELLSYCPEHITEIIYRFYDQDEQLKWYLIHTEDMPNAVDEAIARDINQIESFYHELQNQIEKIIYEEQSLPPLPMNNEGEV